MAADSLDSVFEDKLKCRAEMDKPMSRLSTLGVGGRAERYLEPESVQDVKNLFELCESEGLPLYITGAGSNIVFADGVIRGVVMSTRRFDGMKWNGNTVSVRAGCPLSSLVGSAASLSLSGLEFAFGIPGTVGGAVAGNSGAGGKGVCGLLTELITVEPGGAVRKWNKDEFSSSYRHFSLAREGRLLVECQLELRPGRSDDIKDEQKRFWELRGVQPLNERSAGCSFKNPPGDSAGRMLDVCGCKGMTAGDAAVSERHANFIVNRGSATAADVVSLLRTCRDRVYGEFGVMLEPELRFVGFDGGDPVCSV